MAARRTLVALVAATLAAAAVAAADGDWPRFRGPTGDGISSETGLVKQWPEGGPRELWRTELGGGYSAISVAAGRLYTMFSSGPDEFAVALDAATGHELWRVRTDSKFKDMFGDGPRSTPTVDGGIVYVLSAKGKLYALKAGDGQQVWMRDLREDFDAKPPRWGFSSSPFVEGSLLLLDVGGTQGSSIVAFDKQDGREVWRSEDDKAGYSTPIAATVGDERHVVFVTGTTVASVAPLDGSLRWKHPWKTSYDVNASAPVFIPPDKVFISSGYDVGSAVFRIGASVVEELWRSREMKNKFSSSVFHDGQLYGFDEKIFKCVDAATGEMQWQARGLGHGSLIYADGHLVVMGDKGALALVVATPEEYREKSRVDVFQGKTWTMPTLSGGKLYLRDEKELVSLDVSG